MVNDLPPSAVRLVLVVDDDEDSREMYCVALRSVGFMTVPSGDAATAFRAATVLRPQLIVTDIRMAGEMDGLELTRRLRRDDRTKDIGVIVLSALAYDADRQHAHAAGCDIFLTKPCGPDELALEIQRVLAATVSARSA